MRSKQSSDHSQEQSNPDGSDTQETVKPNPDACLHLPLGMVRCPTPRTRKFLETQVSNLFGIFIQESSTKVVQCKVCGA